MQFQGDKAGSCITSPYSTHEKQYMLVPAPVSPSVLKSPLPPTPTFCTHSNSIYVSEQMSVHPMSLWLKSILFGQSSITSSSLSLSTSCLLCTNYNIIELQLLWKSFKFIFSTDVLPSNAAVIVGLVHLSLTRSVFVLTVEA